MLEEQRRANGLAERQLQIMQAMLQRLSESSAGAVKPVKFTALQDGKVSPKVLAIIDWLETNPDKASLPTRTIAALIGGVSHTLVNQGKRAFEIQQQFVDFTGHKKGQ